MFAKLLPLLLLAACTAQPAAAPVAGPVKDQPTHAQRTAAFLQTCEDWDEWAKPAPPIQIIGNSWYVGTCGITAILVTGEEGHVLIDSGVPEAAPLVLANIRELGFDPADIRLILMSHEHFDHVGAHALLARETGAQIVASERAAAVLESGIVDADDPQAEAGHPPMEPVKVSRMVRDGETVKLGNLELTAHTTPGHTPGALSWTWMSCALPGEPPVCRRVAYVDSLSPVSADEYRFTDHRDTVAAFRTSIDKVRALPCDILMTPHPSASQLFTRLRDGTFGRPGECVDYANAIGKRLDDRLAKEAETK